MSQATATHFQKNMTQEEMANLTAPSKTVSGAIRSPTRAVHPQAVQFSGSQENPIGVVSVLLEIHDLLVAQNKMLSELLAAQNQT
jgi:hypothetical protein